MTGTFGNRHSNAYATLGVNPFGGLLSGLKAIELRLTLRLRQL
jgi:hypothetical protein